MNKKILKFSKNPVSLTLPFYFEATKKPDNDGFPQIFPFKVLFNKKLGMFTQVRTKPLAKILNKAYLTGTMLSGGMNDAYIGKERVDAAVKFIKDYGMIKSGQTVLEIGCGEGQVLHYLADMGLLCTGLEPGPQIKTVDSRKIRIIKDFFPSSKLDNKYDLILHFGVIEHITNPVKFLRDQAKFLKEDGEIICGFPNCEPDLNAGDISLFLHEHYNYFSKDSFERTANLAGFSLVKIEESPGGGMLHAKIKKKYHDQKKTDRKLFTTPQEFRKKANKLMSDMKTFFDGSSQEDIAIYCPLRCMNLLYYVGVSQVRLIDDNPTLHNKFLPTFKKRIENFNELKKKPPKKILIYSKTYDRAIKKKINAAREFSNTEIKSIRRPLPKVKI